MCDEFDQHADPMNDFYLRKLRDENPQVRKEACIALGTMIGRNALLASWELINELEQILLNDLDRDVVRAAAKAVVIGTLHLIKPKPTVAEPQSLAEWFWRELHHRSSVLRVADPQRLRRDEDAVIQLARSLPYLEYPNTEFLCVDPGGPLGLQLDYVKAIIFMGRLCLFGEDAVNAFGMEREKPHYQFGMGFRPPHLARGKLHRKYHAIVHRDGAAGRPPYRTTDVNHVRTDYGLIERYVVSWGGRWWVIINIAGCSSLGTLAAAQFAAHRLFHFGVDEAMIPAPDGIRPDSHLEALVEVKADTEGSESGWKPYDHKLLELRVDNHVWNQTEYRWERPTHETITLVFSGAATAQNYREECDSIEVFFDDCRAELRAGKENRRLCIELCLLAERQGGVVELAQLGRESWIWADQKPKSIAHVRIRLANLRRYFGESLEVDGNVCRVIPRVEIVYRPHRWPR